jgi:DNA helicase HerA-like ATPase
MTDFEKLGVFYLGRVREPDAPEAATAEPLLYDAKDLTTHAVCVGMTGSGKTGLGIGLIEEAALDGIPSLIIDPKGDMGNLLLTFPELAAQISSPTWMQGRRRESSWRRRRLRRKPRPRGPRGWNRGVRTARASPA